MFSSIVSNNEKSTNNSDGQIFCGNWFGDAAGRKRTTTTRCCCLTSWRASVFRVVLLFISVQCWHVCHAFVLLPYHGGSLHNACLRQEHFPAHRTLPVHMVPQTRTTMATPTTTTTTSHTHIDFLSSLSFQTNNNDRLL